MSNLPAPVQRWLAVLLPPFAILVCIFAIAPKQARLRHTLGDIKKAQAGVNDYLVKLQAIKDLPQDPKIATLPMTKQEQSDFLRGLSALCSVTGNRLSSITSLAAPPAAPAPAGDAAKPAPADPNALPAGVVEIKSTIVFDGTFGSLRAFLGGLQRSRRLVSMNDCRVATGPNGYPELRTTLTISRYVEPLPSEPAAAAVPAPAQHASAGGLATPSTVRTARYGANTEVIQ